MADIDDELVAKALDRAMVRQAIWSFLFLFISIVGAVGNLIVIWIVLSTKSMRSVTNLFVVNLAVADSMVAILNISFSGLYNIFRQWYFGEAFCKISQFIGHLSICVSVLTLLAIAIERYLAIMKPLKPRMSTCKTVAIAVAIWSVSVTFSMYTLIFFEVESTKNLTKKLSFCYSNAPPNWDSIYKIVFMLLTYFIPLLPMTVLYFLIGRELWGSKTIGEDSNQQMDNVQKKRRVVKMLIVVVTVFTLCWLPFHIYYIVESVNPTILLNAAVQEVSLFVFWLAMSNSMYNPIIYCVMNERYRDGFKKVFSCCPFIKVDNGQRSKKGKTLLNQRSTSDTNPTILLRN